MQPEHKGSKPGTAAGLADVVLFADLALTVLVLVTASVTLSSMSAGVAALRQHLPVQSSVDSVARRALLSVQRFVPSLRATASISPRVKGSKPAVRALLARVCAANLLQLWGLAAPFGTGSSNKAGECS